MTLGPDLSHVGARSNAAAIRKKILDPGASVTKASRPWQGIMPKDFGDQNERGAARGPGGLPGEPEMTTIRRYAEHPFWQAVGLLVFSFVVIVWGIPALPGSAVVPKSVVLQYMLTVLVGMLLYVSDNEDRWTRVQGSRSTHCSIEPRLRIMRAARARRVAAAHWMDHTGAGSHERVRSAQPALDPPGAADRDQLPRQDHHPHGPENPLRAQADSVAEHDEEGKRLYYQNCLPCHGDHLDGLGHYAHGFNPIPANFQDNGTIAQLTESLRVLAGRQGRSRTAARRHAVEFRDAGVGGFPHRARDLAVIIFLYEQTGWKPRRWKKSTEPKGASTGGVRSESDAEAIRRSGGQYRGGLVDRQCG